VCLRNTTHVPIFKWTRFSRIYNDSTGDEFPKAFIWESGSLFRCRAWFGPGSTWNPPYYWIEGFENLDDPEADPPLPPETQFGMGLFIYGDPDQIDNQDFMELIGEEVDTDDGTFTITQDAHDWGDPQMSRQTIVGIYANQIFTIGKLDPV
jgi:hypothetical protein